MSRATAIQHAATGSSPLYPNAQPYFGVVENTVQALRLVQAAWLGVVPRIIRRLNDTERKEKIVSGAVFIFGVEESGMKRWTDGRLWSPSRIDGNFLVYREMDRKGDGLNKFDRFEEWTPGDDGRAVSSAQEHRQGRFCHSLGATAAENRTANRFKADGLVKKTITVKINGSDHHLICYYTQQDIYMGRFKPMSTRSDIMGLDLPPHIFCFTDFRLPPRLENGPDGLPKIVCEPEMGVSLSLPNDRIGKYPLDRPDRVNVSVSYGKSNGTCTSVSILHDAHQMPSIGLGESWEERSDFLQQTLSSNSESHWSSLAALSVGQRESRPTSHPITHTLAPQYQSQGGPLTHGHHPDQYPPPSMTSNASDVYHLFSQSRDTERAPSNNQGFGTEGMSDGGTRHMGKREFVWPSAASVDCHIPDSRFQTLEFFPLTSRRSVDNAWSLSENTFSQSQHPPVAPSNQSIGQNPSVCIQNARLWTMHQDNGWEDGWEDGQSIR